VNQTQQKLLKRAESGKGYTAQAFGPGHVLTAGKREYAEALKLGWALVREDTGAGAVWKTNLTT